ncbi:MAG: hypothetical protein ACRDBG_19745, partial [Waterburya sp.]
LTIALLDYNGRKGVFSDEYIKNVEREKQIERAREEKFKLQLDRLGKKKKKNKKIRKTFYANINKVQMGSTRLKT